MRQVWGWWATVVMGCGGAPAPDDTTGPLGLDLSRDGRVRAGAAVVDMTPDIPETWTDANGSSSFEGCFDVPSGEGCNGEAFEDVDGDSWFDAVFIGGFGYRRPANGAREGDGISARAVVLTFDGEMVAFVGLDLVGLGNLRIDAAAERLAAEGFPADRLIVASTHNHQGPDTMGLWGDPLAGVSGFNPAYQDRVTTAIVDAVRGAAAGAVPVTLRIGTQHMRDRGAEFNGSVFGGNNPTPKMHGMVHDIRDPVVVSDQVMAMSGTADDGEPVFVMTSWSGHPEVRGGDNDLLSADWVGVTRSILESKVGGVAMHLPECLGGMQSALGGDVPLVEADGTHIFERCDEAEVADPSHDCAGRAVGDPERFADGSPVPVWAEHDSWAFVTSHGWHIAEAAMDILAAAPPLTEAPIRVEAERGWVPIRNIAYNLFGPSGIFDFGLESAETDPTVCPGAADDDVPLGCVPFTTFRVEIGPLGIVTAPGELLPELAWGLPDHPDWAREAADPTARGPSSTFFPQHDPDCDDVGFDACRGVASVGDCDCLAIHDWPYVISEETARRPLLAALDTPHKIAISMTSTYLSYILPASDVNRSVSLLNEGDGDHYEDTVTPAWDFAEILFDAQARIDARW